MSRWGDLAFNAFNCVQSRIERIELMTRPRAFNQWGVWGELQLNAAKFGRLFLLALIVQLVGACALLAALQPRPSLRGQTHD